MTENENILNYKKKSEIIKLEQLKRNEQYLKVSYEDQDDLIIFKSEKIPSISRHILCVVKWKLNEIANEMYKDEQEKNISLI